jgi:hypothetical protein
MTPLYFMLCIDPVQTDLPCTILDTCRIMLKRGFYEGLILLFVAR